MSVVVHRHPAGGYRVGRLEDFAPWPSDALVVFADEFLPKGGALHVYDTWAKTWVLVTRLETGEVLVDWTMPEAPHGG